jgi:glycosyltransferase involved in cell wall biosynthesis
MKTILTKIYKNSFGKYILFMGRLNYIKGPDILIAAYNLLRKKYPDIQLVIIGKDEALRPKLDKLVLEINDKRY